jgi:FkbM family methyltransferase
MSSTTHRLIPLRRRLFELCGSDRYSRPARDDLDKKLAAYLPTHGFFVEAGALDGYTGSNTYYLEKIKGWTGILVEPSPPDARGCAMLRNRSHVFNCALVPFGFAENTIRLTYGGAFSFVEGAYPGRAREIREDVIRRYRSPETFEVPARTLASVLDEVAPKRIDFLSLDVEGFELQVLHGIDFRQHAPVVMLVECQTTEAREQVTAFLRSAGYRMKGKLSRHDYLFLRT